MRSNIPLAIDYNSLKIRGKIIYLHTQEIRVEILAPYKGISTGKHRFTDPKQAPFEVDGTITEGGKRFAGKMLKELYDTSLLFEANHQAILKEYEPFKKRMEPLYKTLKGSPSATKRKTPAVILETLELILWLNHEFFKMVCERHSTFKKTGIDTFFQLVMLYSKDRGHR